MDGSQAKCQQRRNVHGHECRATEPGRGTHGGSRRHGLALNATGQGVAVIQGRRAQGIDRIDLGAA